MSQEVEFDVGWGKIRGQRFGAEDGIPIIALHGYLDNSNSFQPMCEFLPKKWSILALDLPGHGKSDHKPKHAVYSVVEHALDLAKVIDYLKQEKFMIIGHSMGASIGFLLCNIYPDRIIRFASVEMMAPFTINVDQFIFRLRRYFSDALEKRDETFISKVYTIKDATARLMGVNRHLSATNAEILVRRGTHPVEGGYVFSRDPRLKLTGGHSLTPAHAQIMQRNLTVPTIIISARDGFYISNEWAMENLTLLKENDCLIEYRLLDSGGHHLHMEKCAETAGIIETFFSATSELSSHL